MPINAVSEIEGRRYLQPKVEVHICIAGKSASNVASEIRKFQERGDGTWDL
jgi:hypothetical protein